MATSMDTCWWEMVAPRTWARTATGRVGQHEVRLGVAAIHAQDGDRRQPPATGHALAAPVRALRDRDAGHVPLQVGPRAIAPHPRAAVLRRPARLVVRDALDEQARPARLLLQQARLAAGQEHGLDPLPGAHDAHAEPGRAASRTARRARSRGPRDRGTGSRPAAPAPAAAARRPPSAGAPGRSVGASASMPSAVPARSPAGRMAQPTTRVVDSRP